MYLIFLILMVIPAKKYSPKFAKVIGKRDPVETLATVFLLTYTKLLQFVIAAFSSANIEHPNNTTEKVWLLDGTINYYEIRHIIMLIVAIVILCCLSVYTFLLLFWQLLVNLKIRASIVHARDKSLIEMYLVPFKSTHRYWTGLLLLIRVIVYLVATLINPYESGTQVHFTIISLLTLLLFMKALVVRVYKKWPIDVLESVMIALTLIVTGSNWLRLNNSFGPRTNNTRYAVIFTTSVVMACVFIGIIIYHINTYVVKKFRVQKRLCDLSRSLHQRLESVVSSDNSRNDENGKNQREETMTAESITSESLNVNRNDRFLEVMHGNSYRKLISPISPAATAI